MIVLKNHRAAYYFRYYLKIRLHQRAQCSRSVAAPNSTAQPHPMHKPPLTPPRAAARRLCATNLLRRDRYRKRTHEGQLCPSIFRSSVSQRGFPASLDTANCCRQLLISSEKNSSRVPSAYSPCFLSAVQGKVHLNGGLHFDCFAIQDVRFVPPLANCVDSGLIQHRRT